ncbi:MAG: hypothetical protein ACUVWP_04270 [bacterium]
MLSVQTTLEERLRFYNSAMLITIQKDIDRYGRTREDENHIEALIKKVEAFKRFDEKNSSKYD